MIFTIDGAEAYSITGGVKVTASTVLSPSEMAYPSLSPSQMAQLRGSNDRLTRWFNTVFGRVANGNDDTLPSDDVRTLPAYQLRPGFSIEAQEVPSETVRQLREKFSTVEVLVQKLKLYTSAITLPDLTETELQNILDKRVSSWNVMQALTVSVQLTTLDTVTAKLSIDASGIPVPGTLSTTYDALLDSYSMQMQLLGVTS